MGQESNPFYISPGVADVAPFMSGIGSLIKQSRDKTKNLGFQKEFAKLLDGGTPEDVFKFRAANPQADKLVGDVMGFRDNQTKQNLIDTSMNVLNDREGAEGYLTDRIEFVRARGGDPDETIKDLETLRTNPELYFSNVEKELPYLMSKQQYEVYKDQQGIGNNRNSGIKSFAPVTIVNPITKEKRLVAPTVNPNNGQTQLSPFDMPQGFEISKETDEEKRTANVLAKGKEVMTKGAAKRAQSSIDDGYSAANAIPTVSRAIKLLNEVETGGFDNVALRVKQAFGVEGANEGELSNLLGKSVLSQLKPTFGSAFTENEGKALTRIEAGFGKNPKTNLRLLKNALKLYERTANQAIKRAEKAGDMDTVEELQEAMNFSLDEDQEAGQPVAQDIEALTWAKANPSDPRAIKILQMQGAQ